MILEKKSRLTQSIVIKLPVRLEKVILRKQDYNDIYIRKQISHKPKVDYTLFFIRNSFKRNLCWDGQIAKKLSVLKLQRLRNLQFFSSFFYHNFEDTVTYFHIDMLRKVVQTLKVK